ncbi:MFS transporter [Streptomyces millisiae]|uniref:MFS transporter n=1 Tax=Streptomyces millisiae TaxID=3075542 RepID=A0ABU2LSB1_9ACTN|nr:MFS transporter [Streptomyces sp. DSM 44918]MDT0320486.1 MFS transporter [Streptomyces sp. DSM 44918]
MSSPSPAPRAGVVVGVLSGAGITASLMQALIVPLIPELPLLLDTSAANASWAITATLLAAAVATPVVGRLGDLYGKRRMLLVSIGLLVVGSVVSALSDTLAPMVAGRALQGASMGIIPLGISVMRDVLPAERLGSSIALMSASLGIGGALGLPAAAAVAQHADWHALFWGSAALGALVAVLVAALVPESPSRVGGRFDVVGALGLSAGLVALLLPVSKGGDWGWGSATTLGLFAAAGVLLLAWGAWELRSSAPLVDLRATARRPVLVTNLATVMVGLAMYGGMLVPIQLLQLPEATGFGLGETMVTAGLWLAPTGLVMMLVSPLSARISAARGPKVSLLAGTLVLAVGYLTAFGLAGSSLGVLVFSSVVSAGVALAYAAMPALIMGAVPPSETAVANGLNTLMRSIGTSTSSAVIGMVLARLTTGLATPAGPVTLPSEAGFRATFAIGAGASLLAALVVLAIPGRARPAGAAAGKNEAGRNEAGKKEAPRARRRRIMSA